MSGPRCAASAAILSFSVLLTAIATMQQVLAQATCAEHDRVLRHLEERYGETPAHLALTNHGALIEVVVNETGDTWSILVTAPGGPACLVAAGKGWRDLKAEIVEPNL